MTALVVASVLEVQEFYRDLMMTKYLWMAAFAAVSTWQAPVNAQQPASSAPTQAASKSKTIKVPIDSGARQLAVTVWGDHGRSILIEGGGGGASSKSGEWDQVADALAKTNRVYLYDRAGLGDSDPPAKLPRTSADVAADLHQMIEAAKIPTPVVLVGFSLGGMHSLVFAKTYPDQVAGIVLVDSAHADQDEAWYKALPAESPTDVESLKQGRAMLRSRVQDRGENGEHIDMVTSRDQVRAVKSLGAIPLVVLTHSPKFKVDPRLPEDVLNMIETVVQPLQKSFLTLSTHSHQTVAEKAGHAIHVDEPQLVISAIEQVLKDSAAAVKRN